MRPIVPHGSGSGQTWRFAACILVPTLLAACGGVGERKSEILVDEASFRGLDFTATYGADGRMLFHEVIGSGAALVDFDLDGDLDVYLVRGDAGMGDRLFRSDLDEGGPVFVDVTQRVGLAPAGVGMAVSVGDYDADGDPDLYLSNLGRNEMWRNDGGSFREVADDLGAQDERWSTGATFTDLTGDGLLDLFVVNYTDYRGVNNVSCRTHSGELDYCGPESYEPETDSLFHNLGGKGFEDVSLPAGVASRPGAALGVVVGDLTGDGAMDIYVANDGMRNHLWVNLGDGRFEERALDAGIAVNRHGEPEASMGVVLADLDRDGDEDLFLTHLSTETNTLFRNQGEGSFDEPTASLNLAGPSVGKTGFGVVAVDVDGSGWLDLFIANGAVRLASGGSGQSLEQRLAEPNLLFLGSGGAFVEIGSQVSALARDRISRGAAGGDIDNDGRPDILVVNTESPVELLMNRSTRTAWAGFALVEATSGASIGSSVTSPRGDLQRTRRDSGFMSSQDPRLLYRGDLQTGAWRVDWAGAGVQVLLDLPPDRYFLVPRAGA